MRLLFVSELPGSHEVKYLRSLAACTDTALLTFDYREHPPEDVRAIPGIQVIHAGTFPKGFRFDERGTLGARIRNRWHVSRARRRMAAAVRDAARRFRPDLILGAVVQQGAWAVHRSGFHPWVAMAWGSDVLVLPHLQDKLMREALDVLGGADLILANNPHVERRVRELDPSLGAKTVLGPWGIDPGTFRRVGSPLRKELGLEGEEVVFFCRGRRDVYAPEVILRAIRKLAPDRPRLRLLVLGDERLSAIAKEEGVAEAVRLRPVVPNSEMPRYFSAADLYVQANRSDGANVALQEAMACELPVVTTDLPPYHDVLPVPQGGTFTPVDDVDALAGAIASWLDRSPEERAAAGRANRERILERYDWNKGFPKLIPILEKAIR